MDNIFVKELDEDWLLAYMDDTLIATEDKPSKHIACARQACKIFKENNLYVKPIKCKFMVKKIEFLGFVIENGKISMNPMKIKGITDWPAPVMVKQAQSFLEFCNFYHWFIHKYADISHSLNDLLKKTQL